MLITVRSAMPVNQMSTSIPLARLIAQYLSGAELLEFCCCEPPTAECGSSSCPKTKLLNRRDVEAFLKQTKSSKGATSSSKNAETPETDAVSSPLINIRTPDWSFQTLLKVGDLAEAASLALSLSDWKNFIFLVCTSYALAVKAAKIRCHHEETAATRHSHVKQRLRQLLKSTFRALLDHCLSFQTSTQKHKKISPLEVDNHDAETAPSSSTEDTSEICWGPVDSSLQRQERIGRLLHSSHGHRFVTRVASMFGIDLVTHGFKVLFSRLERAVHHLDFMVPDELHLPLPPLFSNGGHLKMVVTGGTDTQSVDEIRNRRKISHLCQKILAHLDQANGLVPCLLPLVNLSSQIQSADSSQKADVSAILKTGSKIGLHSSPNPRRMASNEVQRDASLEESGEEMHSITDCFDELTSLLWFLSARDRLSAAWRRYKRWKGSVTLTNPRWRHHDSNLDSSLGASEASALSVTAELLESCSQYLRALNLTNLSATNPGVHQWWEQDCRQIFTDTCSDWLSCGRSIDPLKSASPGFAKLVLSRSHPGWVEAWRGKNEDFRETIEAYRHSDRSLKQPKKQVNSDYLRFLSLFVEMALADVRKWSKEPSRITGGNAGHCESFRDDTPYLPCYGKKLRQQAAASIDLQVSFGGNNRFAGESSAKAGQVLGKKSLKFILWLHSWAQDSNPFCKCLTPINIHPDFQGIAMMKLNLSVEVLIQAILARSANAVIPKRTRKGNRHLTETSLELEPSEASQDDGRHLEAEQGLIRNEQQSHAAAESTDGESIATSCRTFISKSLPQYLFGESSVRSNTNGDSQVFSRADDEPGEGGDVQALKIVVLEGQDASERANLERKQPARNALFNNGYPAAGTRKSPSNSADQHEPASDTSSVLPHSRQRRVKRPAPRIPSCHLLTSQPALQTSNDGRQLTYTVPDEEQQLPAEESTSNGQSDAHGQRYVAAAGEYDQGIMQRFLTSNGQTVETRAMIGTGKAEEDEDSSFDRYYPEARSTNNGMCLDASSPRVKKPSPADTDDTLRDFTLPSSSADIMSNGNVCGTERDVDEEQRVVVQQKQSRKGSSSSKNGSSVSALVKKIFKLGMKPKAGPSSIEQERRAKINKRSEGEETTSFDGSAPSFKQQQEERNLPKLLTLQYASEDSLASNGGNSSWQPHKRDQSKILCRAQNLVVGHILRKVGDSLKIVQQVRAAGLNPPSVFGSNKASRYIQVPLLTISTTSGKAVANGEDSASSSHASSSCEKKRSKKRRGQIVSDARKAFISPKNGDEQPGKTLAQEKCTDLKQDKCVATIANAGSQTNTPQKSDECLQATLDDENDHSIPAFRDEADDHPAGYYNIHCLDPTSRSTCDAEVQAEREKSSAVSSTVSALLKKLIRRRRRAYRSRHVSITLNQQRQEQQLPEAARSRVSFSDEAVQCDGFSAQCDQQQEQGSSEIKYVHLEGQNLPTDEVYVGADRVPSAYHLEEHQSRGSSGILKTSAVKLSSAAAGGENRSLLSYESGAGKRVSFGSTESRLIPNAEAPSSELASGGGSSGETDIHQQQDVVPSLTSIDDAYSKPPMQSLNTEIDGHRAPNDNEALWNAILRAEEAAFQISSELRSSEVLLNAIEQLADSSTP